MQFGRKSKMSSLIFSTLIAIPSLQSPSVQAGDGSDGMMFYEMIFGNPNQRNASREAKGHTTVGSESCDGYGGVLGAVNSFFCHMEKDMGVTGAGSVTKDFQTLKVHAEIAQTATTVGSTAYTSVGQVWMCNTSNADCAQTSGFSRMYYIAFTYDKDAGINKGFVVNNPGAMEGTAGNAMTITYDVGSASATQTVSGSNVFSNAGSTFKMHFTGSKTSSLFQLNMAAYNASMGGFRFAMVGTPPAASGGTNTYAMYTESAAGAGTFGLFSLESAGLAAPIISKGQCLSAVESGAATTTSTSTGCGSFSFGAFDYYAATGTPNAAGLTATSIENTSGTSWNGMSAHPSAL